MSKVELTSMVHRKTSQKFLVACTRIYYPLCQSVRRSDGITQLFRRFLQIPLLPKSLVCFFYHCYCSPARDVGNRVSGLVLFILCPCILYFFLFTFFQVLKNKNRSISVLFTATFCLPSQEWTLVSPFCGLSVALFWVLTKLDWKVISFNRRGTRHTRRKKK